MPPPRIPGGARGVRAATPARNGPPRRPGIRRVGVVGHDAPGPGGGRGGRLARKTRVLAAPALRALGATSCASSRTDTLWGRVTLAPANPSASNPRTASARREGGTSKGRYTPSSPASSSAAWCMRGDSEWPAGCASRASSNRLTRGQRRSRCDAPCGTRGAGRLRRRGGGSDPPRTPCSCRGRRRGCRRPRRRGCASRCGRGTSDRG